MTPDMMSKLRRSLTEHEDYRNHPYLDTASPPKITIGIGYNLTDRGIDDDWINAQYQKDVEFFYNKFLTTFDWFSELNDDRQIILIDMAYNLGWQNFLKFTRFIDALSRHNYDVAESEMLNSEWANQNKGRANCLAKGMLSGVYDI